jgi:hypothetical protein
MVKKRACRVNSDKLSDESPYGGDKKSDSREPSPVAPKVVADETALALAGGQIQTHSQFLDQIKGRDQQDLQPEQPISPSGPRLCSSNDGTCVGVGEHGHAPWARDYKEMEQPLPPGAVSSGAKDFFLFEYVSHPHLPKHTNSAILPFPVILSTASARGPLSTD